MTKRSGTRVEHLCMATLEKAGYVVMRSAASLGAVDVVAINANGVRCIQCKGESDGRTLRPGELEDVRESLRLMPHPPGVSYELWVWRKRKGWVRQECIA